MTTASALLLASTGVASAQTATLDTADEAAALIAQVAPDAGEVLTLDVAADGSLTANLDDGDLFVPSDGDAPVVLVSTDFPNAETTPVSLNLPEDVGGAPAQVAADGTVYYEGTDSVDVAIQGLDDGVRIQMVLADASAPSVFDFPLGEGLTPVKNADGSVSLLAPTGDPNITNEVGVIQAPWAVDANGVTVPTALDVVGTTVVQTVAHTAGGVTYPVVADPKVSYGWGVYYHYSRAETKTIAGFGTGGVAVASALCVPFGGAVGATVCGIYAGSIVYHAGVAENSSPKRCLLIRMVHPSLLVPSTYRDYRCV